MSVSVFETITKLLFIFGRTVWVHDQQRIFLSILAKIYHGSLAFTILLYYIFCVIKRGNLSLGILIVCCDNIMSIIFGCYISKKHWLKWFDLLKDFNFDHNLTTRKRFRTKLFVITLMHNIYFLFVWIMKSYFSENYSFVIQILVYMAFFSKLSSVILLIFLESELNQVNIYWKNIYKWRKMGLKIRNGQNATFCRKRYKALHQMYGCFQGLYGWLIAMQCLVEIFSFIYFINSFITNGVDLNSIYMVFATWGNNIHLLVSKLSKLLVVY